MNKPPSLCSFRGCLVWLTCLSALSACSTSSPAAAGNTVSGSLANAPFEAKSALAIVGALSSEGSSSSSGGSTSTTTQGLVIILGNTANTCAQFHGQNAIAINVSIPGDPVKPGSYSVVNGVLPAMSGQAEASFKAADAKCMSSAAETATTGTVTISQSSSSKISGSVELTFPGGHVAGSFEAVVCASLPGSDSGSVVCVP